MAADGGIPDRGGPAGAADDGLGVGRGGDAATQDWARGRAIAAAVLGTLAWLALTGADPASAIVGLPSVALAAAVAGRVGRAAGAGGRDGDDRAGAGVMRGPGPLAVPSFLASLVADVFASAWSLALQVFRPRLDLAPGLVTYRLSLVRPEARAAFMNSVTLTPGTLSATLENGVLTVHALDRRADVAGALAALEARMAALYGEAGAAPARRPSRAAGRGR